MNVATKNTNAGACYQKALAAEEAGHYEKAAAHYRRAAALEPNNPEFWARLALVRGTRVLEETTEGTGRRTFNRNAYGLEHAKANAEVESALQQARACPATTASELYWRGVATCLSGEPAAAGPDFAAAVALDPDHALGWYYLGLTHGGGTNDAVQLECYNRALALDAGNAPCLLARAVLRLFEGGVHDALADFEASLQLQADAEAITWRGISRFLRSDFDGALEDFGVWEGRYGSGHWRNLGYEVSLPNPSYDTLFMGWAGLEGRTKEQWIGLRSRWAESLAAFERAQIREPTDSRYLSERFSDYYYNGLPRGGRAHYVRALRDAETVIAASPALEASFVREMRAELRVKAQDFDYAALLADYQGVLEQAEAEHVALTLYRAKVQDSRDRYDLFDYWYRPHYAHCCAWALYHLGDLAGAWLYCARALAIPGPERLYPENRWRLTELPPVPDPDYLLWQVRHQLRHDQVIANRWIHLALHQIPQHLVGELARVFNWYGAIHPLTPPEEILDPSEETSPDECIQFCREQAVLAPPFVQDLYRILYQFMLDIRLPLEVNRPGITPTEYRAAFDHYNSDRKLFGL